MKLTFLGDYGKLKKLSRDIGPARAQLFIGRLSTDYTREALFLVREGFRNGTDPTGRAWRRPKSRKGGRPMIITGALQRSWRDKSTLKKVEIYSQATYAPYLQRGTQHTRPRRMVPGSRLPARWMNRFVAIFWKNTQRLLRGQ